jgi:hypothetical protein
MLWIGLKGFVAYTKHPRINPMIQTQSQNLLQTTAEFRKINNFCYQSRSQVSSGSIVSDYGLDDRAIGVRFPVGAKDFYSSLCVQTGSGAHPASCPMGTGGPFPGGKSAAGA